MKNKEGRKERLRCWSEEYRMRFQNGEDKLAKDGDVSTTLYLFDDRLLGICREESV